jgi:hypothetical protein
MIWDESSERRQSQVLVCLRNRVELSRDASECVKSHPKRCVVFAGIRIFYEKQYLASDELRCPIIKNERSDIHRALGWDRACVKSQGNEA